MAIRSYCAALGALLLVTLLQACALAPGASEPAGSLPLARALTVPQTLLPSEEPDVRSGGVWMYTAQLYGEDLAIYKRKGLGLTFYTSLGKEDYPVLLAYTLVGAVFVVLGNFVADIALTVADPRIRLA